MANVVKPAEFMAEIALKLRENKQNLSDSLDSLRELESLLGDIDNSRDFYTIGKYNGRISIFWIIHLFEFL